MRCRGQSILCTYLVVGAVHIAEFFPPQNFSICEFCVKTGRRSVTISELQQLGKVVTVINNIQYLEKQIWKIWEDKKMREKKNQENQGI